MASKVLARNDRPADDVVTREKARDVLVREPGEAGQHVNDAEHGTVDAQGSTLADVVREARDQSPFLVNAVNFTVPFTGSAGAFMVLSFWMIARGGASTPAPFRNSV